ncbi:MAG: DUF5678 domain-containing protein [Blastocatellia bacterium]
MNRKRVTQNKMGIVLDFPSAFRMEGDLVMSQITCDQVISSIQFWPPEDVARLREALDASQDQVPDAAQNKDAEAELLRARAREASLRNISAEQMWLHEHRNEYAGQWVALKGDQLIHHSTNAKEVFAAAKDAGVFETLVVLVEPRRDHPFINLG